MPWSSDDLEMAIAKLRAIARYGRTSTEATRAAIALQILRHLDVTRPNWRREVLRQLSLRTAPRDPIVDFDLREIALLIDGVEIALREEVDDLSPTSHRGEDGAT